MLFLLFIIYFLFLCIKINDIKGEIKMKNTAIPSYMYVGTIRGITSFEPTYDIDKNVIEPAYTLIDFEIEDEETKLIRILPLKFNDAIFGLKIGIHLQVIIDEEKRNILEFINNDNVSNIMPRDKKTCALVLIPKLFISLLFWISLSMIIFESVDSDNHFDILGNIYHAFDNFFFMFSLGEAGLYYTIIFCVIYLFWYKGLDTKKFYNIKNMLNKTALKTIFYII